MEQNNESQPVRRVGRPRNADRAPVHTTPVAPVRESEHGAEHTRSRRRLRHAGENRDELYIPVEEIPEGVSYEWKRFSVNGQEDPFYLAQMREQGFEPVDPRRHPNWLPPGYNLPHIIKGGLILMERPQELTDEARQEMRAMAFNQIQEAEQRLGKTPKGTLTRDLSEVQPKVTREVGRMVPMPIEE